MAYLDKDGLQAFYTGLKAKFATNADYEVAFPANGWSNTLPYRQTVNVAGLLATDAPLADWDYSDATVSNWDDLHDNFARLGRLVSGNGTLTAYCYEKKPEMDLKVLLKVVK